MKIYNVTIWEWQEEIFNKNIEVKNNNQATMYALGIFNGLRHGGANATGHSVKRVTKRDEVIVSDELGKLQQTTCEKLSEESIGKVFTYGNKTRMPYTECVGCEVSTPTIITQESDSCAVCGGQKEIQEYYHK